MSLRNGVRWIGSPVKRPPGRRLPVFFPVGAAGLALALVLGAGPLSASAGGVARTKAKAAPPPDTAGIHPVAYSLEMLQPFSGGVAAVRFQGKWGYVDLTGKTVVPFLYDQATPFDGGIAAAHRDGRWVVIDLAGHETIPPQRLSKISRFSEGLAAARTSAGGAWGYVDKTGTFVIQPQFTNADPFSQGLAPASYGGSWFYVTPAGALAFGTSFSRAYPFSADGLALVQVNRDGTFGYIRKDGTFAIAPTFVDARPFSQGLAPVRIGSRWGYITTSGAMAIPNQYVEAYPFSGGLGLVLGITSRVSFIDTTGKPAHSTDFALGLPYSGGAAIVGDGKRFWYVDAAGARLPVGEAEALLPGDSPATGGCDINTLQAVNTNYVAGFVLFQIVNQTNMSWNVSAVDTSGSGMGFWPGLPVLVDVPTLPPGTIEPFAQQGISSFLYKYFSGAGANSGTYPLFDVTLTSKTGGSTVTLSSSNDYTAPAPNATAPWWDFLSDAFDVMEGMFSAFTGDEAEAAIAVMKITESFYDIIDGTVDGNGNNNLNQQTQNVLVTQLTGMNGSVSLQPLGGGFCGGDSYTISDDANYVFALTTVKSKLMPPTVQLTISPYAAYFAQNALAKLDMFRKGTEPSGGAYTSSQYYSCIYNLAFESWSDTTNNNPCSAPATAPTYDYMTAASSFSPSDAPLWWNFANNLPSAGTDPVQVQSWMRKLQGRCGTVAASCPNGAPMTASPTNMSAVTDGPNCIFDVAISNPWATPTFTGSPLPSFTPMPCSPATTLPCSIQLNIPAPTTATYTLTDGSTQIPLTVSCTSRHMVLPQTVFQSSSFPGPCLFSVTVSGPRGPVTVTPSDWVVANTCTASTDGNCVVSMSVPSGWGGGAAADMVLTDGQTYASFTLSCKATPMTLPQTSFSGISALFLPCTSVVNVNNPHGPITLNPATYLGTTTCTGPMAACQFTMTVPVGTSSQVVTVGDGSSTATLNASCQTCSGMTLPQGNSYTASKSGGCGVTVPVQCATPPVKVTSMALGGSANVSGCGMVGDYCAVVVTAPYGGAFVLSDGAGSKNSLSVQCTSP